MSLFKKILTLGGNEIYNRAMVFYNRGEYESAIQEFEKITKGRFGGGRLHPQLALFYESQSHRNLGLVAMHEGRYDRAAARFEKAVALTPENEEIHVHLGICYNNEGQYESAIREFSYVVQEEPKDVQGYLRLAIACVNTGRYEEAGLQIAQAFRMERRYADFHYLLGVIRWHQTEYAEAVRAFEEAVTLNPKYRDALIRLGYACAASGDFSKAHDALQRALSVSPKDAALKEEARLLEEGTPEGEKAFLRKAEAAFRQPISIDPRLADTLTILRKAEAEKDIGFYNTLAQIYRGALKDHPQYADFHYGLGHACQKLDKRQEAAQHYERALAINPNYIQAQVALASCYLEMGNREEAKKIFERLIAGGTDHPDVFYHLGRLLGEEGNYDRAIGLLEKALSLKSDLKGAREALEAFRKKKKDTAKE